MYVIAASGGGFKGAFQVPILQQLISEKVPDLILGVSVGALNGVMASQMDFDKLYSIWETADQSGFLNRFKSFFRLSIDRGLFSLDPIREKLQKTVKLSDLQIPFGCGAVSRIDNHYRTFLSEHMSCNKQLYDAVIASCAISGLIEPIDIRIGGKTHVMSDGGHKHTIPLVPQDVTDLDVILCDPIDYHNHVGTSSHSLVSSVAWAFDIAMQNVQKADIVKLKEMHAAGVNIRIFHPKSDLGHFLKNDKKIIDFRINMGLLSIDKPYTFK